MNNKQSNTTESLTSFLFNAIIAWYDDSLIEYHGINDDEFIQRVCNATGMSRTEYNKIMKRQKTNEFETKSDHILAEPLP